MTTAADQLAAELYRRYADSLCHYAQRLTGDHQLGEDVVQETLLKAWLHADRLVQSDAGRRAWLFRVAHNTAVDRLRHRHARSADSLEDGQVPSAADDVDGLLSTLTMSRAMAGLSAEHRSVLYEVFYLGSSTREAARSLRIPHGTAKSRLHYGLRRLRGHLPATF